MKDQDLHSAKERLFLQTKNGILTNFPMRPAQFQSLKKLKYLAILRAYDRQDANKFNLPYLSNQIFHTDIVNIVHKTAVFDSNRQRREIRSFFEENIIAEGSKLMAAERVAPNLVVALSPENIHRYMSSITGYGTENIKFAELIEKERVEIKNRQNKTAMLRDEAMIGLIETNRELLESLRRERPEMQLSADRPHQEIENTEYVVLPRREKEMQLQPQNVFQQKLLESRMIQRERMRA